MGTPRPTMVTALILVLTTAVWTAAGEQAMNGETPLHRLLREIETRVQDTRTVQCRFEQERNLAIFTRPILFTGRMVLSRPDRLRWENIAPVPSVLILSGKEGQRCNDDAAPVRFDLRTDPVMRMVTRQIWTWVDGDYGKLKEDYNLTLTGDHILELTPKPESGGNLISAIRITFDRSTLQPRTIRIDETGSDSTVIRFSDYQLNQAVDDSLFTTCHP